MLLSFKPQGTSTTEQRDISTASNSSPISEQTESTGSIGIGFQQATKVLQSVVGTLNVGNFFATKNVENKSYIEWNYIKF